MRLARLVLLLLLPIALGIGALVASDRLLLATAATAIELTTPYQLELQGATMKRKPFAFSADLMLLRYQDPGSPPLLSVQNLAFEAPLFELLRGTVRQGSLSASNVSLYLTDEGDVESPSSEALLSPLARLPEKIDIGSIHILSKTERLWIFPLLNVSARHFENGSLGLIAAAQLANEPVVLELLASPVAQEGDDSKLEFQAEVTGRDESSKLGLQGQLQTRGPELFYALKLNGQYENVGDFVSALDPDAYPFAGTLLLDGELTGSAEDFVLSVNNLELDNSPIYRFSASGRVVQHPDEHPDLDMIARGRVEDIARLSLLPASLSTLLEKSELSLRLGGTLDRPTLSETALTVSGAHGLKLELRSADEIIDLSDSWLASRGDGRVSAMLRAYTDDLRATLAEADIDLPIERSIAAEARAVLRVTGDDIDLQIDEAVLIHPLATLSGNGLIEVRGDTVTAPTLKIALEEKEQTGKLHFAGSIGDMKNILGIRGALTADAIAPETLLRLAERPIEGPLPQFVSGTATIQRAAKRTLLRDLDLQIDMLPGVSGAVAGTLDVSDEELQADLTYTLNPPDAAAFQQLTGSPVTPTALSGQLRLRPTYATTIAAAGLGDSAVQIVASADLDALTPTALAVDIYSASLATGDLKNALQSDDEEDASASTDPLDDEEDVKDTTSWKEALPAYPLRMSLRVDELIGELSLIEHLALAIDGEDGRYILQHFDASYAGGDLMLRGVADLTGEATTLSIAGQGLRVPLAALTQDLGLQQSVQGELSLRGGITTRGYDGGEWKENLQGRMALALKDTTVSGAAYDLLMSNLLAWVVSGASREKETTFDCTMAQFDFAEGMARSDSLYLETPRMLATGKASIDLREDALDVRLEPKSKTRTFQFPSAVKIRGPLNDPKVSVSPLQVTFDASAQALLLLPSLTLKLFGIGNKEEVLRPCEASLQ